MKVAYMEFLKANGIEDSSFIKEMDYQEVLNSQEIFGNELEMFAKKDRQKEVVVPKQKGEILGMVIVESGWGSMLPTVVIANMAGSGPAARCGMLNIGDQIIAINGVSLVGLPLSTCQTYIKVYSGEVFDIGRRCTSFMLGAADHLQRYLATELNVTRGTFVYYLDLYKGGLARCPLSVQQSEGNNTWLYSSTKKNT